MVPNSGSWRYRAVVPLSLIAAAGFATLAIAQSGGGVQAVIQEQAKTEQAAIASQAKIAQLDDESSRMLAEYRQISAEAESLKSYNDQLAVQVKSQTDELQQMTRQIDEIETTSREVLPMMNKMLATLEQFVALDIPFLPEERANRIAALKDMMSRADVSISEKYRRIVEAYQIEIEYGRTIEAYQGKVDDRIVDFLRTGRVALMYQTLDGKETGYWDNAARAWKVDRDYGEDVQEGSESGARSRRHRTSSVLRSVLPWRSEHDSRHPQLQSRYDGGRFLLDAGPTGGYAAQPLDQLLEQTRNSRQREAEPTRSAKPGSSTQRKQAAALLAEASQTVARERARGAQLDLRLRRQREAARRLQDAARCQGRKPRRDVRCRPPGRQ